MENYVIEFHHEDSNDNKKDEVGAEGEDDCDEFDFHPNALQTRPIKKSKKVTVNLLKVDKKGKETSEVKEIVAYSKHFPLIYPWVRAKIIFTEPPDENSPVKLLVERGHFKVCEYSLDNRGGQNAINMFFTSICDLIRERSVKKGSKDGDNLLQKGKDELGNYLTNNVSSDECFLGNLENILMGERKGNAKIPQEVIHLIKVCSKEVPYKLHSLAVKCPEFFKSGAIIFPHRIQSIVDWNEEEDPKRHLNQDKFLEQLEATAVLNPWKFGFNDLMLQMTGFSGLEAKFSAIKTVFWFENLKQLKKDALLLFDMFRVTCKNQGHTFLSHSRVNYFSEYTNWNDLKKIPDSDALEEAKDFLVDIEIFTLAEGHIFSFKFNKTQEVIHLTRYWKAEDNVVRSLNDIGKAAKNVHYQIDLREKCFTKIQNDKDQMKAAESIIENPITIVSGRGGTGKTQVVSDVLRAVQEKYFDVIPDKDNSSDNKEGDDDEEIGEIVYCAPTGKAANVISRRVESKAFTIHQIIKSFDICKRKDTLSSWKFRKVQIVAVDECSMVSPELFSWLLNSLMKGANLQKLILLGDHQQLPSVDPGNLLEDLYKALQPHGLVITLITNHRSEGHTIFNNATKISNQQLPSFGVDESFIFLAPHDQENAHEYKVTVIEEDNSIKPITHKMFKPDIDDIKKNFYASLLQKYRESYGFGDDETSQIISFRNVEGKFINDNACPIYNVNGHMTWKHKKKQKANKEADCQGKGKDCVCNYFDKSYQVGDKIICTKNADVEVFKRTDKKEEFFKRNTNYDYKEDDNLELETDTVRLMNGQMFKIRAHIKRTINDVERQYMVIDDLTGVLTRVSLSQLESYTRIKHSWAVTIHKMQGSEADTIVYVMSGSNNETWKHVYTAVTRGKKKVVIVGYYKELVKAIMEPYHRRQTTLEKKVRNLFGTKEKASKSSETEERKIPRKRLDSFVAEEEGAEDGKSRSSKREASSSPEIDERRQKRRLDSNASIEENDVMQLSLQRCENLLLDIEREGKSLINKASECQEVIKHLMKPPEAGGKHIDDQEARERAEARRLFDDWWRS